jgi:hypothetical protein
MTVINNHTGVPHFWFEKSGATDQPLDVLVVRATFDFASEGETMTLADTQTPIGFSDEFDGPAETSPLRAVVAEDGDLLPYKPGTDVLVLGHAQAPGAAPHTDWLAGIRVGPVRKMLHLHGPRQWHKNWLGWKVGAATPVTRVPLDYRLAYGGCIDIPAHLSPDGEPDTLKHDSNPAGCGWLPDSKALKQLAKPARQYVSKWLESQTTLQAPQILAVDSPLSHPEQNTAPQGLGPLARWWAPRVALQGSYDDAWRANRYPLLPNDFDAHYYQSAAPDMVAKPHLAGDEIATLIGLLSTNVHMRLPGWRIIAAVKHTSGEHTVSLPLLDTVRFDLDSQQASLVWRVHFDRSNPIAEISLAATTQEIIHSTNGLTSSAAQQGGGA